MDNTIGIEVVYANTQKQKLIRLSVPANTTVLSAIQQSGILELFPEIDLTQQTVGIFSQPRSLTNIVEAGDRIEIYRPLMIDPKEARRKKVIKPRPPVNSSAD